MTPIGFRPVLGQVAIGMACASYWRGAWYFLDDHLYPENTFHSAVSSLGLGTVGMTICQGVAEVTHSSPWNRWKRTPTARFAALYAVSTSCVLVWRGAWLLCDVAYEEAARYYYSLDMNYSLATCEAISDSPTHRRLTRLTNKVADGKDDALFSSEDTIRATDPHHRTISGLLSHGLAMAGLLCVGRFASVLAPPARASIARDAPLYAKTLAEYSKTANWLFQKTK